MCAVKAGATQSRCAEKIYPFLAGTPECLQSGSLFVPCTGRRLVPANRRSHPTKSFGRHRFGRRSCYRTSAFRSGCSMSAWELTRSVMFERRYSVAPSAPLRPRSRSCLDLFVPIRHRPCMGRPEADSPPCSCHKMMVPTYMPRLPKQRQAQPSFV